MIMIIKTNLLNSPSLTVVLLDKSCKNSATEKLDCCSLVMVSIFNDDLIPVNLLFIAVVNSLLNFHTNIHPFDDDVINLVQLLENLALVTAPL